ncbi:hypothetical protein D3C75_1117140 [compost metagenome]
MLLTVPLKRGIEVGSPRSHYLPFLLQYLQLLLIVVVQVRVLDHNTGVLSQRYALIRKVCTPDDDRIGRNEV